MSNSFKYQQQLLEKYQNSNEQTFKRLQNLENEGLQVTCTGTVCGPYVNYITYFLSNGETLTSVAAAPLRWIPDPLRVY